MVVGNGLEEKTTQGPLISADAIAKVQRHIADAVALGAGVVTGGDGHDAGELFFQPTVLTDVSDDAVITREETFGPVAALYRFDEEEEVIARANATPYGLAAYCCTRDLGRAMRVSQELESGIVGINEGIISSEVVPFGGVKESGIVARRIDAWNPRIPGNEVYPARLFVNARG